MSDKITVEDIAILMDSLETWQNKGLANAAIGMITAISASKNKEEAEEAKIKVEREMKEYDEGQAIRKEQCIILQAKLIKLKQKLQVEEITN